MQNRFCTALNERVQNFKQERDREIKSCRSFWRTSNDFYLLFGLGVGMTVYLVLGAAILTALEGGAEQMRIDAVSENQQRLIDNLTETFNASRSEVLRIFNEFHDSCERGLLLTQTVRMWDFGSAVFFAITVVTTIGYGHIAPSTASGKTFCVFYALVGIPLCLILLTLIGKVILWQIKFGYAFFSRHKLVRTRFVGLSRLSVTVMAVLGLTLLGLVPAIIIGHIEQWDYAVSLYYTFVSCSTIGFGDLVAGQQDDRPSNVVVRNIYKVAVGVWLFLGMGALAIIITAIKDVMELAWRRMKYRYRAFRNRGRTPAPGSTASGRSSPSVESPPIAGPGDSSCDVTTQRGEGVGRNGCEEVAAGDQSAKLEQDQPELEHDQSGFEHDHSAEDLERQAEMTAEEDTSVCLVMEIV